MPVGEFNANNCRQYYTRNKPATQSCSCFQWLPVPYDKPLPGKGVIASNPLESVIVMLPDLWSSSAARYNFLDEALTGCDVHSRSKHALTSRLVGNAAAIGKLHYNNCILTESMPYRF